MKPPPFEYHAPRSTAEALALLGRYGADAKVLAGGQSLVPLLNFRLARPAAVVDINGIGGLDAIAEDGSMGEISLGARVRQTDAERSTLVERRCPLLAEALRHVGHRTIRNRGTVGGSLAHADPSAELPLVLRALDGRVRAASERGERWVPARDLFVSYLTTSLAPDELLLEARFPFIAEGTGWGFQEFSRRSGDFAIAAACATVAVSGGSVARVAIAVAGGGPTPVRAEEAERLLVGPMPDAARITRVAQAAAGACEVEADMHASAEGRRELIVTLTQRVLGSALGMAQHGRAMGAVGRG